MIMDAIVSWGKIVRAPVHMRSVCHGFEKTYMYFSNGVAHNQDVNHTQQL